MKVSLEEVENAVGGHLSLPKANVSQAWVRSVSIDSRKVEFGSLFFAFPGEKTDGHLYVEEAFCRGAAACVVSHPPGSFMLGPMIQVRSVEKALMRLAQWYQSKIKVPVIGITGSSGKSTTKEIAAELLSTHLKVLAAPESYNNEIGVPLTLLSVEPEHQAVVLEMAMRGSGQIRELCDIAAPSLGLVTSVGAAHIGLLGSIQAIADAKGELLEALPDDGTAFLNSEDEWTPYLKGKSKAPVRTFGFHPHDWVRAQNVKSAWEGSAFRLVSAEGKLDMNFPLLGEHNLLNFLGGAALALTLGAPLVKIKEGAARLKALHGRLERRKGKNGALLVDDSYNANPSSALAALKTMQALLVPGRRIFVLGDMLELGGESEKAHEEIGVKAFSLGVDALFGLGDLAASTVREARKKGLNVARHFPDQEALISDLKSFIAPGDLVLVKGSRKMAMENVVEALAA